MKKSFIVLLALVLIVGIAVGGTVAWLTADSGPVTNTFTTSDISVELKETTTDYKMIPGYDISKDPKAKVTTDSVDCYLFVKIEEANNTLTSDSTKKYFTYTVDTGWTQLTDGDGKAVAGVYYKVFDSKDTKNTNVKGTEYSVLSGDKVTVSGDVTKSDMTAANTSKPTLTFTAYASQLYKNNTEKFDAYTAWTNAQPTPAT